MASVLPHHLVQVHQLISQILKENKVYENAIEEHNEVYIDATLEVIMVFMKKIISGESINIEETLAEIKPQISQ